MTARRWLRFAGLALGALAALAVAAIVVGAPMGLFSGKPPSDLGFANGAFAPGDGRPNWVSSTVPASDAKHYIAPLAIAQAGGEDWAALEAAIAVMPRARVVTRRPGYLHVEFSSAAMGFVDDAQFALDASAGVIHVKSGARLGVRDFDVNRKRVESIRQALSAGR